MPDDVGGIHCTESFARVSSSMPDDMDLWVVTDLWRRAWKLDGDKGIRKLIPASYDCTLNCENDEGITVLHVCAFRNHAGACRMLLKHQGFTKTTSVDCRGETALHYAARLGNLDACNSILESDRFTLAAVEVVSLSGGRAVDVASVPDILDLLSTSVAAKSELLWAQAFSTTSDDSKLVRLIELADPLTLNYEDGEGATLLHTLAFHNHALACTTLLTHPDFTKANNRNHLGETALHYGARSGQHQACQAILSSARFKDTTIGAVCHNNATAKDLAADEHIGDLIRQRRIGLKPAISATHFATNLLKLEHGCGDVEKKAIP